MRDRQCLAIYKLNSKPIGRTTTKKNGGSRFFFVVVRSWPRRRLTTDYMPVKVYTRFGAGARHGGRVCGRRAARARRTRNMRASLHGSAMQITVKRGGLQGSLDLAALQTLIQLWTLRGSGQNRLRDLPGGGLMLICVLMLIFIGDFSCKFEANKLGLPHEVRGRFENGRRTSSSENCPR